MAHPIKDIAVDFVGVNIIERPELLQISLRAFPDQILFLELQHLKIIYLIMIRSFTITFPCEENQPSTLARWPWLNWGSRHGWAPEPKLQKLSWVKNKFTDNAGW